MVKVIITSFFLALLSLVFAVFAVFGKNETVFIVNLVIFYFSSLLCVWLLSLPIDVELAEFRNVRIFSFVLLVAIVSVVLLAIGFLLLRFYFK